jgi:hypothetical protein
LPLLNRPYLAKTKRKPTVSGAAVFKFVEKPKPELFVDDVVEFDIVSVLPHP